MLSLFLSAVGCSYNPPETGDDGPATDADANASVTDTTSSTDDAGSSTDTRTDQPARDTASPTCSEDEPCDCNYEGKSAGVCGTATVAPGGDECRQPTAYEPTEKSCDNIDNDCDGSIDENLARPCGKSTGPCQMGTQRCLNGQWGGCQGSVEPSEEVCDGKDNDCDGEVDDREGTFDSLCADICKGCVDGQCKKLAEQC